MWQHLSQRTTDYPGRCSPHPLSLWPHPGFLWAYHGYDLPDPVCCWPHQSLLHLSSHLVVVSLFYGTAIFIYIRPKASYDPASDPLVSLFYAVVTPILNPIIYSLRNADVKAALKRTIKKMGPAEI